MITAREGEREGRVSSAHSIKLGEDEDEVRSVARIRPSRLGTSDEDTCENETPSTVAQSPRQASSVSSVVLEASRERDGSPALV
jgi:hypothetical protein